MADPAEATVEPGRGERVPILDAIVAVLNNGADAAIVRDTLGKARVEMADLRQEMVGNFETLEPRLREACENPYAQVHNALDVYTQGLDLVESWFADGERTTLVRGGEHVRRGHWLVNEMLLNFRNCVLGAMGPTDIPDYNMLYMHYERVKRGEAPRDGGLSVLADRFYYLTGNAGEEAFKQPPSEARDLVLTAYRRHLKAIDLVRQYVREGREELLEKGMADLRDTFKEIRDVIPAVQMKMRSGVPTAMPTANFVINMAVEVAAGRLSEIALRDALDQLRGVFDNMRRQFESVARGHIESVLISEEAQKVRDAFQEMEKSIDELYNFFDIRDGLLLGAGCNGLVDAVGRLHKSHEVFMELAAREGKTLCLRCSHYSEKSRRTCEQCGAVLIQASETGVASTIQYEVNDGEVEHVGDDVPMPDNVKRMFEAVNRVAEGEMGVEEFEAEVAWLEDVVEQHANSYGIRPLVKMETVPSEQREQLQELMELTREAEFDLKAGADLYREGLRLYRVFIADGNKDNLTEGTRSIWEGTKKLHQVQQKLAPLQETAPSQAEGSQA